MDDQYQFLDRNPVSYEINPVEGVVVQRSPLDLDIPDDKFIQYANDLIADSKQFWENEYDLSSRQRENEKYLFGRQLQDMRFKVYNSKYLDNIIWDAESYLKPIAMSRMPDFKVEPGNKRTDEVAKFTAEKLTEIVENKIKDRARRRVMGVAYRHIPAYYFAVIKYIWNPEKGSLGDIEFILRYPRNIVLDRTCTTNNIDDMRFFAEYIEDSVLDLVKKFPKKEQEIYKECRAKGIFTDTKNEKTQRGMASIVKYVEIWFKWSDKVGDKWTNINSVGHYFGNTVLDRMKNPNYDYSGGEQTYTYKITKDASSGREQTQYTPESPEASQNTMEQMASGGLPQNVISKKVFKNHFENPRFPYIVLVGESFGKVAIGETSRIEQNIKKQENIDKRGKQISEMLDRRGKHVFSKDGGVKKETLEEMDMADPDLDILISGDVRKFHDFIPGEQPSAPMIQNEIDIRNRIFASMGVNGPMRGQTTDQPATNNQIARDSDFTRNEDYTDETINFAAEEMANATLQLMKLRYTREHFIRLLGESDGNFVFETLNRDLISDGVVVDITASGSDKLKAEQNAMDEAKIKLIDPLSYYEDMDRSDPVGRTERLMLFLTQPLMYLQHFVYGQGLNQMAGQPQQGQSQTQSPQAQQDMAKIMQGQIPPVPQAVDPNYANTLDQIVGSQQFQQFMQQSPQLKPQIVAWLTSVHQLILSMVQQGQGGQTGLATPLVPQTGSPGGGQSAGAQGNVGPVANAQPSPSNPTRAAITPPRAQMSI